MILIVIICVQATSATLHDMALDCDSPNFKEIYVKCTNQRCCWGSGRGLGVKGSGDVGVKS